ncbi:MAG: hypothetical protein AMXMBFR84_48750 [Candidatus Hydrogenedentota bacterium]
MSEERTGMLRIRTPEGIAFSYPLAGPVSRFLAWIIDAAVMALTFLALLLLVNFAMQTGSIFFDLGSIPLFAAFVWLGYYVLTTFYAMALEWFWRGRTIGKWVLRLRVINEQGLRLQFSQVALRNLLRFVDCFPTFYLVGGLTCFLSKRSQRLGDFVAGTVVVRENPVKVPDIERILGGKYNSFREYPHLEARLRRRIDPEEARIALTAIVRRDRLDPASRIEVFRAMADRFRAYADFPEEATFALTDEQYVRNVVDVLFRTRTANTADKRRSA